MWMDAADTLEATIAYLASALLASATLVGFLRHTIVNANKTRHRWIDLSLAHHSISSPVIKDEREQLRKDFHAWYGGWFFACSVLELMTFLVLVSALVIWCGICSTEVVHLSTSSSLSGLGQHHMGPLILGLVVFALFLLMSHSFAVSTYRGELSQVFRSARPRHRALFPLFWSTPA